MDADSGVDDLINQSFSNPRPYGGGNASPYAGSTSPAFGSIDAKTNNNNNNFNLNNNIVKDKNNESHPGRNNMNNTRHPSFASAGTALRSSSIFSPSFTRNTNTSFAKSWSCQFLHGKMVPPIEQSTLRKEDQSLAYNTSVFSEPYKPFWTIIIAFFLMFVAYNLSQNLSPSVFGGDGAIAIAVIYIFFVISSIATPSILTYGVKNNASLLIFLGSISYTFFIISCAFGQLWFLIVAAACVGLSAGPVWVTQSVNIVSISRWVAEKDFLKDTRQRLHNRLTAQNIKMTDEVRIERVEGLVQQLMYPNGRVNVAKLTDEQMKRLIVSTGQATSFLNSCSWIFLNVNTVVGGLVAYFILGTDDDVGNEVNPTPLFIFFSIFAIIANVLYFIAYRNSPVEMYDVTAQSKPLTIPQHDENRVNRNKDVLQLIGNDVEDNNNNLGYPKPLPPVHEDNEEEEQDGDINHNQDIYGNGNNNNNNRAYADSAFPSRHNNNNNIPATTYTLQSTASTLTALSAQSGYPVVGDDTQQQGDDSDGLTTTNETTQPNPLTIIGRSMYLMFCVSLQRVVFTSMIPWIQSSMPNNFVYSLYTANVVKPALGVANVTLIIITVAAIDSIAAFVLTKFMKTFVHARLSTMLGSCFQLSAVGLILFGPELTANNTTKAWIIAIITAILTGIGDACHQSGSNSALGMVAEDSRIRSAAFSVCQVCKSIGSIILFISARVAGFWSLTWFVFFLIITSLISQGICWYYHLPLDIEFILGMFEEGTKGKEKKKLAQLNNDDNIDTTLDGLGSSSDNQQSSSTK